MKKILIAIVVAAITALGIQARMINIHGKVTIKGSKEPAAGYTIFDADAYTLIGITGDEGRYVITADSDGKLLFSGIGCEQQEVPVDGRMEINVTLIPTAQELEEVSVTAKATEKTLITEPTDLDVAGNYVRLKTKVRIPNNKFKSEVRMILQPAIYNVTRKKLTYLKPVVYDGWRYASTQERMGDWDKDADPLTPYQQVKSSSNTDNMIYLSDSMYIENPKDDYVGLILSSMEDYEKILYSDTIEIARGTVNPLRFLNYSLTSMSMNDERYYPTPEVELRDASGEINLVFPVGKSNLDMNMGNNAAELNALINEFKTIENSKDMTLKSFRITGSASPEGRYETNVNLASARMKSAMETVLNQVDPSLRRNAEISSDASVAKWEEVVSMLRADGHNDEADKVQDVLDRYSSNDSRTIAMKRLPFYESMIASKYLPRLRRVNYNIVSSRYRPLTDEEIAEIYATNPKDMSKYQLFRYYNACDTNQREAAIRKALEVHPDFVVAATDLSDMMLRRGENPIEVLEPFFADPKKWYKLPTATRYNMGVAAMGANRYTLADSLLSDLPDNPQTHKAKIYNTALQGNYKEVISEISADSPLNEVLLLLAMKENQGAAFSAQSLGNSAVEEYVKAIAANRLDDYETATTHLNNALRLDPSLIEIAKVDGDVLDLLDLDGNIDASSQSESNNAD